MAASEKRRQDLGDHLLLADDHAAEFLTQGGGEGSSFLRAQRRHEISILICPDLAIRVIPHHARRHTLTA